MNRLALALALLACPANAENQVVAPADAVVAGLPFSPGVLGGDFLYLSGAIGNEPGTKTVEGDVRAQVKRTLDNLGTVLGAAGLDFSRVVSAEVFLQDARHFEAMNEVYGSYFADDRPPARTTIEADIAIPGAEMEIGMIAARKGVELEWIVPEGWLKSPLYAWGVRAGDTLFISGMVSFDPKTGQLVRGDLGTQTRKTLENVGAVLEAAGMSPRDVVSCGVFLEDARGFQVMNEVYRTFFPEAPPARATVRARLADPDLAIEVQCTAVRGEREVVGGGVPGLPFSPAVRVGDRLFLSGMVGRAADGTWPTDVAAQTRRVLERLGETLKAAGLGFGDVVSSTVYLSDVRYYAAMNEVYAAAMPKPPPARATVGTPLMSPDAWVEIKMIAVAP